LSRTPIRRNARDKDAFLSAFHKPILRCAAPAPPARRCVPAQLQHRRDMRESVRDARRAAPRPRAGLGRDVRHVACGCRRSRRSRARPRTWDDGIDGKLLFHLLFSGARDDPAAKGRRRASVAAPCTSVASLYAAIHGTAPAAGYRYQLHPGLPADRCDLGTVGSGFMSGFMSGSPRETESLPRTNLVPPPTARPRAGGWGWGLRVPPRAGRAAGSTLVRDTAFVVSTGPFALTLIL
jgi:hypothetical protein